MKNTFILHILLLLFTTSSYGETVSIPTKTVKKPAVDLLDKSGANLDVGLAAQMAEKGEDLSQLDPMDNKLWQNQNYSLTDADQRNYPQADQGVTFQYKEASSRESYMSMYMARVQSSTQPGEYYRLTLSRSVHAAVMRAALLRRLGYFLPSPRFYKNLVVRFSSEEEKEKFLKSAQESMGTDFTSRNWVLSEDKNLHTVTLASATLEPASSEYFDIHWGFVPSAKDPSRVAFLQRLSRYRAFRALILPLALIDIPESINRYSAKSGAMMMGDILLTHPYADSFSAATYEDVRWLARKLSALSPQELKQIVDQAQLPQSLSDLVYAKLVHRIHNILELFDLQSEFRLSLPSLQITSSDGYVLNGKVTQELIPGYPLRFAHGDRSSPYSEGDLGRYLEVDAKSSLIQSLLDQVNKKLEVLSVQDLADKRQQDIIQKIQDHIRTKPHEPLYREVESWGGPIASGLLRASRHVSTGTYYQSSAPVQLVDNLSVGGTVGVFMALDGIEKWTPISSNTVSYVRDYTHVRPILSLQEGSKQAWKDLLVPNFMKGLAKGLTTEESVDQLLRDLRDGEVFTITDSIALSTYNQVNAPLDNLLGLKPFQFLNSVSFGADASRVILSQTAIMRTKEGLQIFIRKQKSNILGAQLDVNYFINVLRLRAQQNNTDIKTDAFVIEYDPEYVSFLDLKDPKNKSYVEMRKNLQLALPALLKGNNTEFLYGKFPQVLFKVEHELNTKELQSKFLWQKMTSLRESHLLSIQPPANPDQPNLKPEDAKVLLYSYKRGQLVGRDLLGFAMDLVDGLLKNKNTNVSLSKLDNPNPANMPYGKAYWRLINTEAELSSKDVKYPMTASLQHVWGGWSLSQKKFFDLIDEIEKDLNQSHLTSYRLIEKEAFQNVQSIDFYRITKQLSLLPEGIAKIRDLITQPDADGKSVPKAKFLARLFQKLSQMGKEKARANDKEMFDDLISIIGGGNAKLGMAYYTQQCQEYYKNQGLDIPPSAWQFGTNYDCLVPWMKKLIDLSRAYPTNDRQAQTKWSAEVLYILDEYVPLPLLMKYLGDENYIFFVRVNGFRKGDEDGDLEFFSNTIGRPPGNYDYSNGLINYWAKKSRISPIELDRSNGGFR
ncbi:MAG: hypothetical protein BroJett040_00260 [Oligoflexia bacterium]|nr:MAG: hypothetical protein BroJett040_00260 [Oligoflexia bacterium]